MVKTHHARSPVAAAAWRVPHKVAAPSAMIGTSNFFELVKRCAGPGSLGTVCVTFDTGVHLGEIG